VTGETLGDVLRRIGRLAGLQGVLSLTDAQLLERFAIGRDEPAFAALMVRHGPMVLGVCRRLLHDADQAEDAFQAAFLVLARKAGAIQRRPLLSAWLYGVAYKVAARLRGRTWRRQARETSGADLASVAASVDPDPSDLPPLLHQEVQRLPDKYRNPIVLCYLEGKTHEEAALLLRWPLGTVKTRLARARDLLRSSLTRRGVTASEEMMATALAANSAKAPAKLVDTTIRAATRFAAGDGGADGLVSARAIALSQGVLRTMILTKMKIAGSLLLTIALLGGGAGWLAFRAPAAEPSVPIAKADDKSKTAAKDKPKERKPEDDKKAIQGVWQLTGLETNDKEIKDKGILRVKDEEQWFFQVDTITIQRPGRIDDTENYRLYPSQKPKKIDTIVGIGTMQEQVKDVGIYSLEGDVLKLCFPTSENDETGRQERPTELAVNEANKNIILTFKRVSAEQDKPKDDAKVNKLIDDWCDATKLEFDARMQEFQAGKILPFPVLDAAQRLFKAEVERSATKENRLAAYEAHLRRITAIGTLAKEKLENGRIAIADVMETKSYRLEAEILLEREKAK
jgi:RNA polymerase sigma factor (sigma-70 family)